MRRAINLAHANLGLTDPNPSVGCVIVRDGEIVGEGATAPGGRPHAEELALDKAGDRARGATAYVTLEPCGARSAGHASCSLRLVEAGVACVVVACDDASLLAAGRGLERLKAANIAIETNFLNQEASFLYANYRPAQGGPKIL